MGRDTSAAIVVPCYNEGQRLPVPEFDTFLKEHPEIAFLFVDDGSTDNTADRLAEIAEAHPANTEVIRLSRNGGKAAAVRSGMRAAFAREVPLAGYWDADLATPLDEIPRFIGILEDDRDCLVLLGARVRLLGRSIERRAVRHYTGRVFGTLASLTLGLAVYDTQCGAKLFRVSDETKGLFDEPFGARWVFDVELLARLVSARRAAGETDVERGLREVPLHSWTDVAGSTLRPLDFVVAARDLLRIYRTYRPRARREPPAPA